MKKHIRTLLFLVAGMLALIGTSFAWFTLSDRGRVSTMSMEITNGVNLYFDTEKHDRVEDYLKVIPFEKMASKVNSLYNYDLKSNSLEPTTTKDGRNYLFEDGTIVKAESGAYIEIPLHFIATKDMYVHLTSENDDRVKNGTLIETSDERLLKVMRISFDTGEQIKIYNPSMKEGVSNFNGMDMFGLNDSNKMIYSENNLLFFLKANEDKEIILRIWVEGTDENCTNDLKGSEFSLKFKFVGTNEENSLIF